MQYRWNAYRHFFKTIEDSEGGLDKFSQGDPALPASPCHLP